MLERKIVIEKMKRYNRNCSILKELKRKLSDIEQQLYEEDLNITTKYDVNIKSKNKVADKVAKTVINKEKQEAELKQQINDIKLKIAEKEREKDFVDGFLDALKKSDREIIVAVYVDGLPINQVITEVYFKMYNRTCEPKTINTRLGKPIDDLIRLYNKELG